MILIDPKGILHGKRLRKLSARAHLYYPFLLGMSNFYARLEWDKELMFLAFVPFKDAALTPEELSRFIDEYRDAGLVFVYEPTPTATWLVFDTPVSMRRSYASAEDNASPAPPTEQYVAWLQSLHGDRWFEYDLSQHQQTLSEKRSEAGKVGGKASGEARRSKTNGAQAIEPVVGDVVVVGVGDVVGDVVGGEVSSQLSSSLANELVSMSCTANHSSTNYNGNTNSPNAFPVKAGATATIPSHEVQEDSAAPDEDDDSMMTNHYYAGLLDGYLTGGFPNGMMPDEEREAADKVYGETGDEAALQAVYDKYPMHDRDRLEQWSQDVEPLNQWLKAKGATRDLYMVLMWAYGNPHDDFWLKKTVNMKAFVSHMMKGKMYAQFREALLKPDTWRTQYFITRDAAGELDCPLPMPMSAWYGKPPKSVLIALMQKEPPSREECRSLKKGCPLCEQGAEKCNCQYKCRDCEDAFTGLAAMCDHPHPNELA